MLLFIQPKGSLPTPASRRYNRQHACSINRDQGALPFFTNSRGRSTPLLYSQSDEVIMTPISYAVQLFFSCGGGGM